MKKIFKSLAYMLVIAIAFSGCKEEDILKSTYDYVPNPANLPTVTLSVGEVTGASVECTGTVTFKGDTTYIEKGFVCATDLSFKNGVVSKSVKGSVFKAEVTGLKELTEYYVVSYIITKDGVASSDVKIFTTPMLKNPLADFAGVYVQSDYKYADESLEAAYNVELVEIQGNTKQMKLKNFWDGGAEIIVDFDLANKKVSIANSQVIYVSGQYGDTKALPYNGSAVSNTPLIGTIGVNGEITFDSWSAQVTAGSFGRYKKSTLVPATNTLAGVYTEVDYKTDGSVDATYNAAIVISPVPGELNKVKIKNFWDGGDFQIEAIMDFNAKKFTIAPQIIYKSAQYGDCYIYSLNVETNTVNKTALIDGTLENDGSLTVGSWAAGVEAGYFGKYLKSTLTKAPPASIRSKMKLIDKSEPVKTFVKQEFFR